MTGEALNSQIQSRIEAAGLDIPGDVTAGCAAYLQLLSRWNQRMNLTALPLGAPTPARTIDKLIIEPLCVVDLCPERAPCWLDLGSGGGSPAIPLRLACRGGSLTMVESRARKAAFLREAVRTLGLGDTHVEAARFDEIGFHSSVSFVTMRAVRVDEELVRLLSRWLMPEAIVLCFGSTIDYAQFRPGRSRALPDGSMAREYRLV